MEDAELVEILTNYTTVAVVGCSRNPVKEAHTVPKFLQAHGFRIIPVNPHADEILGEKAYPSLREIPVPFDIVNLFRPSEQVAPIVEEALETDAKVIWMQLGIRNEEAARRAREAGLMVIQNRCIRSELYRLGLVV